MVLDRDRLGGLLVRAARPARNLSSSCENGRLDNVRYQLVAERNDRKGIEIVLSVKALHETKFTTLPPRILGIYMRRV